MSRAVTIGAARSQGASRNHSIAGLLLLPIAVVSVVGFLAPVASLLIYSFRRAEGTGAVISGFTLETWKVVLQDQFYHEMIFNSIGMSLLITVLTLIASYPIALYLHRATGLWRTFLLVLVISPLLLSAVVRTYGWIAILGDQGLVNNILSYLGASSPFRLVFNLTGVVVGLTEILMPYMILALLAGFGRLDHQAEDAALMLGATPFTVFSRIILPLSLPGVALGSLLTFVLAVSSFITPKLLGGGRLFLLATEIYDQAIVTINWPVAATLSGLILLIFGIALFFYVRLLKNLL